MNILVVFKLLSHLLFFMEGEVLFKSIESKTGEGRDVFNKISLESSEDKDVWSMKQSHHGVHSKVWDKIKIIVDKKTTPFTVSYHQLNEKNKEIDYKTSCFRCHAGGPRLIRPKSLSGLKNKLLVLKWNMLIKSYGDVTTRKTQPFKRKVHLIKSESDSKEYLQVASCTSCHNSGGPRAPLSKSHSLTIKHLLKTKSMPPWPYKISAQDKADLKRFIYGF